MKMTLNQRRYMMGLAMFLMFMAMGMWLPSLPNILVAHEARWALPYAFALTQLMGIFSTLLIAALSDRKIQAQKLLGVLSFLGAGFLWLAFSSLSWGWHPVWYLVFQSSTALVSAPMIPLITKIKLTHLSNPERMFPLYSLCGTLGWLIGGVIISALGLDTSANAGRIGAGVQVLLSVVCFLLPVTLPEDRTSRGWKAALGFEAFVIFKNRELRIFYIASTLIAIPFMSFFMSVPVMLKEFGSSHPAAQMTIGQGAEVLAILLLSIFAGRYQMRWLLMLSMVFGVARFALLALAGATGLLPVIWLGIALHGPIYTCMTIAGRIFIDRRVSLMLRGQAQALYSLLVMSIAGIIGSFFCEWMYRYSVISGSNNWVGFWLLMTAFAIIPLIYFFVGIVRKSRKV